MSERILVQQAVYTVVMRKDSEYFTKKYTLPMGIASAREELKSRESSTEGSVVALIQGSHPVHILTPKML